MSNLSTLVGIIVGLITIAGGVIAFFEYVRRGPSKRELIIRSMIIIAIVLLVVGGSILFSSTTTISVHTPTSPLNNSSANSVTSTLIPSPTPSPTPTLITMTKNLDIPCIACGYKLDIKLTTIVIDTSKQESAWNFTLTNNGNPIESLFFSTLVLEDNTGQKHQGGGLASTDRWNMSSGQSIQTYATFDVVHGTNYLLYISVDDGPYQTETIAF